MVKNIQIKRIINTLLMCLFVFVLFFSSIYEIYNLIDFDSVEIIDDLDKNKSEKEIEFEADFIKKNHAHEFFESQNKKQKFLKPDQKVKIGSSSLIMAPPWNI